MTLITFRCDGATLPEIGTGHVIRDLTLANGLVSLGICQREDILFAVRSEGPYAVGADIIDQAGFSKLACADSDLDPKGASEGQTLSDTGAKVIIFDRLTTDRATIEAAREKRAKIVSFDDLGSGKGAVDLVVNAILYSAMGSCDRMLSGYDYLILPESTPNWRQRSGPVDRILVSFGGYDRNDLSGQFLDALPHLSSSARVDVVIGEVEGKGLNALKQKATRLGSGRVFLHRRPKNFGSFLDAADMAIVAGGLTIFQCVAAGVPVIGFSQYDHQRTTLKRLAKLGVIENGDACMHPQKAFVDSANKLLSSDSLRRVLSKTCAKTIDHDGLPRVISAITKLLSGEV